MFEHLSKYIVILVSGPQRSGTTVCAKMIAHDTNMRYIPEETFKVHKYEIWKALVKAGNKVVIQCPAMSRYVHEFGKCKDVIVVWMRRDINDIIASQQRINWGTEKESRELEKYEVIEGPIAKVKYDFWAKHQKPIIKNVLEVKYKNLSRHSMWLPKSKREKFKPRQTELA